jgi:hypothetical protein
MHDGRQPRFGWERRSLETGGGSLLWVQTASAPGPGYPEAGRRLYSFASFSRAGMARLMPFAA